jgi:hypothetical protein
LLNDLKCPQGCDVFKSVSILKPIMNYFNSCTFNCKKPGCNVVFKYADAGSHLADHDAQSYKCVLECGDADTFKGHGAMRTHLKTTCAKAYLKCKICKITKIRSELIHDNHKCDVEQLKVDNQLLSNEVV